LVDTVQTADYDSNGTTDTKLILSASESLTNQGPLSTATNYYFVLLKAADNDGWYEFVKTNVDRWSSTVNHWEIWNEPETSGQLSWQPYAHFIGVAVDAIKASDPTAKVLAGPEGGNYDTFLEDLVTTYDALSYGTSSFITDVSYATLHHMANTYPSWGEEGVAQISNINRYNSLACTQSARMNLGVLKLLT